MAVSAKDIKEHFLECGVCMFSFDEDSHVPKVLPCQHTFCDTCLATLTKDTAVIVCPVCQAEHKMDKELHKDNTRRDLRQFINQRSSDRHCTQCEMDGQMVAATSLCPVCNDTLCTDCSNAHRRTRITSSHVLEALVESPLTVTLESSTRGKMCTAEGHVNEMIDLYCRACRLSVCKLCVQVGHKAHTTGRLSGTYRECQTSLKKEITELKTHLENIRDKRATVRETKDKILRNEKTCEADINTTFDSYMKIVVDRKQKLIRDTRGICHEQIKPLVENLGELEAQENEIQNMLAYAEAAIKNADQVSFLEVESTIKSKINEILQRIIALHPNAISPIMFHTDEQTKTYVSRIGTLTTTLSPPSQPAAIAKHGNNLPNPESARNLTRGELEGNMPRFSYMTPSVSSEGHVGHSMLDMHEMESSKLHVAHSDSLSAATIDQRSYRESKLESHAPKHQIQPDTFVIIDLQEKRQHQQVLSGESRETDVPNGRLALYKSPVVKAHMVWRMKTWSLVGDWKVDGTDIVMRSGSKDDAEQCLQMLREAVVEKAVPVKPQCMFLVESDKWQILKNELQRTRYPDQVFLDVHHDSKKVICYATNDNVLQDSVDVVKLFFRDNDIKTFNLTYPCVIVKKLQKNVAKIKSIQKSLSQFCVEIKAEGEENRGRVCVKGIGVGLTRAVLELNKLVMGFATAIADPDDEDEDRFSSDDDEDHGADDDSKPRFEDDEVSEPSVSHTAAITVDGMESFEFQAMCLAGETTTLFAVTGDITELPVEAIINSADSKLRHSGGLAKAIVKKGGLIIQQQCKDHVTVAGALNAGDVYCSTAGTLRFAAIIHAVPPKWKGGNRNEEQLLRKAVYELLSQSAKRKITSLAIPALGTGVFDYPIELATTCIVNTLSDFMNDHPHTCLREVYLTDINPQTAPVFGNAMAAIFGDKYTLRFCPDQAVQEAASAQARRVFANPFM